MLSSISWSTYGFVLGRLRRRSSTSLGVRSKPPFWDSIWQLPMLQPGRPGAAFGFGDYMQGVKSGMEEQFMEVRNSEGIPQGQRGVRGDSMFEVLRGFYDQYGPVYKTTLGIASGISVADPVLIRHVLTSRGKYDKGLLGLISEDACHDKTLHLNVFWNFAGGRSCPFGPSLLDFLIIGRTSLGKDLSQQQTKMFGCLGGRWLHQVFTSAGWKAFPINSLNARAKAFLAWMLQPCLAKLGKSKRSYSSV